MGSLLRRVALAVSLALGSSGVVARAAQGETTGAPADAARTDAPRTRVLLRVDGAFDEATERVLGTLLASELAASGLSLTLERPEGLLSRWVDAARAEREVLLIVALDASRRNSLELYVIDAARGRAISRQLPGGVGANAAQIEAIASIVTSAAAALRDGLEVASRPLAEVVPSASAGSPAASPAAKETSARPAPVPASSAHSDSQSPLAPAVSSQATTGPRFGAGLALGVSSFADDRATYGLVPGLSLRPVRSIGLHATAFLGLPNEFDTSLGEFSIQRSRLDLTLGATHELERLLGELELGAALELLARRADRAAEALRSTDDVTFARIGPLARLRLRYALTRWLGLELAGTAAYFPRRIRFVAGGDAPRELAEPARLSVGAELGLSVLSWKE